LATATDFQDRPSRLSFAAHVPCGNCEGVVSSFAVFEVLWASIGYSSIDRSSLCEDPIRQPQYRSRVLTGRYRSDAAGRSIWKRGSKERKHIFPAASRPAPAGLSAGGNCCR